MSNSETLLFKNAVDGETSVSVYVMGDPEIRIDSSQIKFFELANGQKSIGVDLIVRRVSEISSIINPER